MSREVCGYCGLEVPCGCGVIQRNSVSAQSELDRLRKENAALREAFEALSHAFAEVSRAYCNPRWFTGGHKAAIAHIYRWLSDGEKIIAGARAALQGAKND